MVRVAAFDLDGTIVDGETPLKLSTTMLMHFILPLPKGLAMLWWGIRYRLRLPIKQSTPREILFSTLRKPTVEEVDAFILDVYNRRIRKHIRPGAVEEVRRCKEDGMQVILASASFKPITTTMEKELGFDGQVSTVMEEKDGHYTGRVVGEPVAGEVKAQKVVEYCNEHYGKDNWVLERAYSDHYSDTPMLELAQEVTIISPDKKLARIAEERGWKVADWGE